MKLETSKTLVQKSAKNLFESLDNVANFKQLMPDNINKFELLTNNSFVFALKGMPEIYLEKKSTTPYSQLVLGEANGKIPFQLTTNITEISDNESEVQLVFEGNFNPVMAMMVKTPISKFMETLVTKMQTL
ncbi:orotate phosphoribosyltransferase [Capnocytophaga sp. oral taxon 878]|uniref:orotate phosphoribosyltransferase n=1 Tax=Capnocytophaga sp. oral taxon 878 TaxID=1316596 RepID=UPI000D032123|nr:orotate phosphoribosyltransferase [Capnocytophaga sp. oral taxon 878]AVM49460.1 orotate phosphoribosyltransferase [Capnocytophaga sp. oral taxon 878]